MTSDILQATQSHFSKIVAANSEKRQKNNSAHLEKSRRQSITGVTYIQRNGISGGRSFKINKHNPELVDQALNLLLTRQEREKDAMYNDRYHGSSSTFANELNQDEEFEKRFERAKKMQFNAQKCRNLEYSEPSVEERGVQKESLQLNEVSASNNSPSKRRPPAPLVIPNRTLDKHVSEPEHDPTSVTRHKKSKLSPPNP